MGLDDRPWIALGIVLGAITLACLPALDNELVWDDLYVIRHGTVIHDWSNAGDVLTRRTLYASSENATLGEAAVDTWRPVTVLTFFWDSSLSGRDPLAYHVTNLLAHLACVALVFLLARRVLGRARRQLAGFAAAGFGLSPLLGEAHLWINGRSDLFCTLFGLAAVILWRRALGAGRAARRRHALHAGAAVLFFLGLCSKEVLLFALPALLLFPTEEGRDTPSMSQRVRDVLPLALAGATYLAARAIVLDGLRGGQPAQLAAALVRLPVLLLDGAAQLVVPTTVYIRSLSDDYRALGVGLVLALGAVTVLLGLLLFRVRRQQPVLAWGALWFACTLAPAAVIATMLWPGFGRYLYLPAVGLAVGLADAVGRLLAHRRVTEQPRIRRLALAGGLVYCALLGVRLYAWEGAWQNEDALYGDVIDNAPARAHGWGWLGMTRLEEGRAAEAVPLLERADRLAPQQPRYLRQLAHARWAAGDRQGALNAAATGIARHGDGAADFHVLAAEILGGVRPDLARQHLAECLRMRPHHPRCSELRDGSP